MLITVTGRMVKSHGKDERAFPSDGRIELTPLAYGVHEGALRGRETAVIRVSEGVPDPVEVTPGPWRVRVKPDVGSDWDSWQVELEPGMVEPVDLADLAPVVVIDGEKWSQGPPGEPGASVTGAVDNGDQTVSFTLSDGTETAPVTIPPGPQGEAGPKGDPGESAVTETAFSAGIEGKAIQLPQTTFVTVPFGAAGVKSNVGGGVWWPNESEWTVPATGVYTIVATVRIADSSEARSVGIGVHTANTDFSDFIWGNQGGIQRDTRMYSRIARLNAGDRMRLYLRSEAAYTLKAASLSIARIS